MNSKNKLLTVFGIVIILGGLSFALISNLELNFVDKENIQSQQFTSEMIISTIKEEIPTEYKSSGYDVVAVKTDNGAYDVGIGLSTDDARFTSEAQCGVAGFDLINNLKLAYPTMDKQINKYHLVFFANSSRTYTATCYNDDLGSTEDAIKLIIMDNDNGVIMEEKTYKEYLAELESENENQAQTDTTEDDNEDDEELSYTERFYDGGSEILPSSEKYNYRNENSTLYQYEHDYCLRYFQLDSVKMSASKTEAIVFLTFKNTSTSDYTDVYVYCDYMDDNGIVIYQSIDSLDNVQSGRIYAMELSEYYGSNGEIPVSFRISKISFYYQSGEGNSITFD